MNRTSGSLKNVVYGKNCAYIENDRFRYISGKGEMQMQENLKLVSQVIKLWQLWRLSLRRFPVSLPWKRPFPGKYQEQAEKAGGYLPVRVLHNE